MKPTSGWPVAQEARKVVANQMEHYNKMMADKESRGSLSQRYAREQVAKQIQPFYNMYGEKSMTKEKACSESGTAKRKLKDQQIPDSVNAMLKKQKKTKEKKLYLVDTIVTFRHKYVVEADELSHAYDEVTMRDSGNPLDDFGEVTQRFIGETITDGREISKKEFLKLIKEIEIDKDEISSWWLADELIRKIDYTRS